jgi:hypothetical protein
VTSEGSTRDYFGSHVQYVDHRDPNDIRRGIDHALAEGRNPALKSHVTSRFEWSVVTEGLLEVYKAAMERKVSS